VITPGCIVRVRKYGDLAWVADKYDGYTRRWRLVSKKADARYRTGLTSITAGEGDCVLMREAPSFTEGEEVFYRGVIHTVARDLGDSIELIVPEKTYITRGRVALRVPGGNHLTVSKADLVLFHLEELV
jgi:hypothetical protein